jgi:tRNA A37 threonylcarbamoyladenosine dehydratase
MNEKKFQSLINIFGEQGFAKLQNSHIAIVGLGGVGSWAAEALARSGIGKISLIDMDEICVSNVNRQIHALDGEYGKFKIEVLATRLLKINKEMTINQICDFYTEASSEKILEPSYDFVIDAIDSLTPKCHLIAKCQEKKIPIIVTGGAGGKIDPFQIKLSDLNRSFNDDLLYRVRKKLKKDFGFTQEKKKNFGIPCIFSPEEVLGRQAVCNTIEFENTKLNCQGSLGSVCTTTSIFGLNAAAYVINTIARSSC